MKLLEKILLATDFSKSSEDAVKTAIFVAKTFNSEIILLHTIPELKIPEITLEMVKTNVTEQLQKIQNNCSSEGIPVQQAEVVIGTPFEKIIQEADLRDVNVIMMGSGDKTSTDKFQLGITAERVMRWSLKPVWVVQRSNIPPLKRILCPIDLSESSRRALKNAIHLARRFHAALGILYVIQPVPGYYLSLNQKAAKQQQEKYAKQKHDQFERYLKDFDFHNVQWTKLVKQGEAHEEIINVAHEIKSDLMVMGSVGLTNNPRIFIGKVAEKVTRELPCSIITVKSEGIIKLKLDVLMKDIENCFRQGNELLEQGFPEEAKSQFDHCLNIDRLEIA